MPARRSALVWLVPCALALASPARAGDPESAKDLFDRGVERMEAGRLDEACPSIERSLVLDPRPGTLFTLAECEAQRGRIARAFARYDEYLEVYAALPPDAKVRQRDRERTARAQKAALGKRVPTLRLVLPPRLPPGMVVERDDVVIGETQGGIALPVEPGKHIVAAAAPGMQPWRQFIVVPEGASIVVVIPALDAPRAQPASAPEPAAPVENSGSAQRVIAAVTGGAGLAAVAAGAALGVTAKNTWGELLSRCTSPDTLKGCRPADAPLVGKAGSLADGSTALFVIGGAAVVAAAVLLLTAPSAKKTAPAAWRFTPAPAPRGAAGVLEGTF